jgi:hypothetical protein
MDPVAANQLSNRHKAQHAASIATHRRRVRSRRCWPPHTRPASSLTSTTRFRSHLPIHQRALRSVRCGRPAPRSLTVSFPKDHRTGTPWCPPQAARTRGPCSWRISGTRGAGRGRPCLRRDDDAESQASTRCSASEVSCCVIALARTWSGVLVQTNGCARSL